MILIMILKESHEVTRILVPNPLPQKVSKHKREQIIPTLPSYMEVP